MGTVINTARYYLEQWKSQIHGKIIASVAIIGLIWGALIAIIVKVIS